MGLGLGANGLNLEGQGVEDSSSECGEVAASTACATRAFLKSTLLSFHGESAMSKKTVYYVYF